MMDLELNEDVQTEIVTHDDVLVGDLFSDDSQTFEAFYVVENSSNANDFLESNIGLPAFPQQFHYKTVSSDCVKSTISSRHEAVKFIKEYSNNSNSEWRVLRTYKKVPEGVLFKQSWRCQYNVQQRRERVQNPSRVKKSKNCQCPCFISITVNRSPTNEAPTSELDYLSTIKLNLNHNHDLHSAMSLKNNSLHPDIKNKIVNMFRYGHGASSAIKLHMLDLLVTNEQQYDSLKQNSRYKPSVSQIQHFLNHFKKNHKKMLSVEETVNEYLLHNPGADVNYCALDRGANRYVTVITPLMAKVHEHVPECADVVQISISHRMNRQDTKIILLTTQTVIGPLPLGLIIIVALCQSSFNNDSPSSLNLLKTAFKKFKSRICSYNAFYGRREPKVILADHSILPEVQEVWSNSEVLISQDSLLRSAWLSLQSPLTQILSSEREELYGLLKEIMFSKSKEEFLSKVEYLSAGFSKLENLCTYWNFLRPLLSAADLWVDYHRSLKLKENDIHVDLTELPECKVEVLSRHIFEQILSSVRNLFHSVQQTVDFVLNHFESYYDVRMIKLLHNRSTSSMQNKHLNTTSEGELQFTVLASPYIDCYYVQNNYDEDGMRYFVDPTHRVCSCTLKEHVYPCQHMAAVLKHIHNTLENRHSSLDLQELCSKLLNNDTDYDVSEQSIVLISNNCDTSFSNHSNLVQIVYGEKSESTVKNDDLVYLYTEEVSEALVEESELCHEDKCEGDVRAAADLDPSEQVCFKDEMIVTVEVKEADEFKSMNENILSNEEILSSEEGVAFDLPVDDCTKGPDYRQIAVDDKTYTLFLCDASPNQSSSPQTEIESMENAMSDIQDNQMKLDLLNHTKIRHSRKRPADKTQEAYTLRKKLVHVSSSKVQNKMELVELDDDTEHVEENGKIVIIDPTTKSITMSSREELLNIQEERTFHKICDKIRRNPSLYRQAIRDMIKVFEAYSLDGNVT